MVTVKHSDLLAAFEFVSSATPSEHEALVSLDTGLIHWISATGSLDEEDVPDDLETSDRYVEIPHKNDVDLGKQLVFQFVEEHLPQRLSIGDC